MFFSKKVGFLGFWGQHSNTPICPLGIETIGSIVLGVTRHVVQPRQNNLALENERRYYREKR